MIVKVIEETRFKILNQKKEFGKGFTVGDAFCAMYSYN